MMNHISNVGDQVRTDRLQPNPRATPPGGDAAREVSKVDGADHAEISDIGQLLSVANDLPDVRAEKVAEIRTAIEQDADQFIRDRLDGTVDRLLADLRGS